MEGSVAERATGSRRQDSVGGRPLLDLIVLVTVIGAFCVPLFLALDRQQLENDEAIYSFAVDVMVEHGDWLTPKSIPSETAAFLEKPPLKFWIVALPMWLGLTPHSETGMRLWDALMGAIAFVYVFVIGRRLAGPVCGAVAVFVLFVHGPLLLQHGLRTNNMEAAVFLAYAGAIYHFMAWRHGGEHRRRHVVAVALYFVLGFMTKFVAALFLPAILALAAIGRRADRRQALSDKGAIAGAAALAVALIAPWFMYQYSLRGPRLFDIMFGAHVVRRFTEWLDPAHLQPWHFYLSEMGRVMQENGTLWLAVAGVAALVVETLRKRPTNGVLVMLWFILPIAAISFGTSKLYHYTYPFLPPVAVAAGYAAALLAEGLVYSVPNVLGNREGLRKGLMIVVALSLLLAAATYLLGSVRIGFGETRLFRNSSVLRPLAVAFVALLISVRLTPVRWALAIGLVAWLLPLSGYGQTLSRSQQTFRPIPRLASCIRDVSERITPERPPGVWVEARAISFVYHYYLRGLGPWQERNIGSNPTVAMHLYTPALYRPVLLSLERHDGFAAELGSNRDNLLARAAIKAEVDPRILFEAADRPPGVVDFGTEVMLLPGPYAACVER
jgi:4-amino-4-deoxy-L-arabinose transferase-like glycosyltransferase